MDQVNGPCLLRNPRENVLELDPHTTTDGIELRLSTRFEKSFEFDTVKIRRKQNFLAGEFPVLRKCINSIARQIEVMY